MAKGSKKAKTPRRDRKERRFEPHSTANPRLVMGLGGVGAAVLGAGFYGQFIRATGIVGEPLKFAAWLLAGGAVVVGAAVWMGTSGDAVLRVGDGGVGVEKGGTVRRMPWHAVEAVRWSDGVVELRGKDESDAAFTVSISVGSHPDAAAWAIHEARERVPKVVEVPSDAALPARSSSAGEVVALEPLQVVGKHCADTGEAIAYEPDARLCTRCERVFHRAHVPEECPCGASLDGLRAKD